MKVWVSYVTHEEGLGTYVLGVRQAQSKAQGLAQSHWDLHINLVKGLEWSPYEDLNARGLQSINTDQSLTYYVEESDLDLELDGQIHDRVTRLESRVDLLANNQRNKT